MINLPLEMASWLFMFAGKVINMEKSPFSLTASSKYCFPLSPSALSEFHFLQGQLR